jgi:hypothetical protein
LIDRRSDELSFEDTTSLRVLAMEIDSCIGIENTVHAEHRDEARDMQRPLT